MQSIDKTKKNTLFFCFNQFKYILINLKTVLL